MRSSPPAAGSCRLTYEEQTPFISKSISDYNRFITLGLVPRPQMKDADTLAVIIADRKRSLAQY